MFPAIFQSDFSGVSRFISRIDGLGSVPVENIAGAMMETLVIAVSGTSLGFVTALVSVTLWGRSSALNRLLLGLPMWTARGIPDVVAAVLLIQILGFGPAAGSLAIAFGTFGAGGKAIAEVVESLDRQGVDAIHRGGATRLQANLLVVLPNAARELIGQFLLRLEISFRVAIVLGLVGGGGLGLLLDITFGYMDYSAMLSVVAAISIFVLIAEFSSRRARRQIEKSDKSLASQPFLMVSIFSFLISPLVLLASIPAGENRFSSSQLLALATSFLEPDFLSQGEVLWTGMLSTMGVAALSTLFIFLPSILFGILGTQALFASRALPATFNFLLALLRSVPIAVIALVLVVAVGLGPAVGFLGLVIGGSLYMGRVIGDAFDSNDGEITKTLYRSGAPFAHKATALIAEKKVRLVSFFFFVLDFTFRYAVTLGILGVGGIGTTLVNALRVQDLNTVWAATILIVVTTLAIELMQKNVMSRQGQVGVMS